MRIVVDDQVVQLDAAALEQHIAACQEALALLRAEGELG